LEGVEDINKALESNCVHGSVGVSTMVLHNFEDARTLAFPRLGFRMLAAKLRYA